MQNKGRPLRGRPAVGVTTTFRRKTSPRPFDLAQDSPRRLFAYRHRSWWGKRGGGQPALSADVPSVVEGVFVCASTLVRV